MYKSRNDMKNLIEDDLIFYSSIPIAGLRILYCERGPPVVKAKVSGFPGLVDHAVHQ